MVKVKICGITNLEDALFCSEAGSDALGFIFYKKSPRYISFSKAEKIIKKLDPFVIKVGVFVNEKKEKVLKVAKEINLDVVQLHGEESKDFCDYLIKKGIKVIKAFFPKEFSLNFKNYKVDAYLFDVEFKEKMKKGYRLKEEIIKNLAPFTDKMRIIISGGLNCGNIKNVLRKITPYAVDVASGVEISPGKKDKDLVKRFIKIVKNEIPR